eukprot:CAMPEP_0194306038 /NCGR_PEP_ID=MMETSP0171-20130528/3310_1 /TAXON_ID=218684 /ORGANISM="Corethron pennatum, Strain L29A3" /LENGTH=1059 /DNA_ID=CAMNT_0039057723 /DNA_START=66 /DNA_END=3245 /DNA_ORIENTATION=+
MNRPQPMLRQKSVISITEVSLLSLLLTLIQCESSSSSFTTAYKSETSIPRGTEEIEAGRRLTFPASLTDELVHGFCVTGADSAEAHSSLPDLTYTEVRPFVDGTLAWDDRSYTYLGIIYSPCAGGIFLRPALHKSIEWGTVIDVAAIPDVSGDVKVCAFLEKNDDRRNGRWPSNLAKMGFAEYDSNGFGWSHKGLQQLAVYCKVLPPVIPTGTPTLNPSISHGPSIYPSISDSPTISTPPTKSQAPRGYVFVPHTNWALPASDIAPLLKIMYRDQDCADILLSNEPNIPNFYPGCGLKSDQSRPTCQRSNAGLFYWPSGERNAYYDPPFPPYNHNRTKMIAHARDGINGYGEAQSLVLHPESSYAFLNPGEYGSSNPGVDVPEYVYEGVRLWSEAVEGDVGSGRVLLILSKIEDAGAVFGIASTFRSMGLSIIPVAFAVDLLPEALKVPALYETSTEAKEILAAIEAGCLYSHEMDQQFVDEGFLHNYFTTLSQIDISDIMAAAHQAVQDGKQFSDVLSWASSVNIAIPQAGGASWFGSVKTRNLRYETWGTSTERDVKNAYGQILYLGGMSASFLGNSNKGDSKPSWKGTIEIPSDIMLKRSMASGPGPSDYFPDKEEVKRYRVWMKFDYQIDKKSAAYGDWNVQCLDASYYGATYNAVKKVLPMIRNGQKANYFPTRWFMAQEVTESPYPPGAKVMRDDSHMSGSYLKGMASGMLTLATGGRSFIGDKPNDNVGSSSWHDWHARRTGYILAWRLATLRLRPPFLEVKPTSSKNSDALPYGTEPGTGLGSATVRLLEAPESEVMISIEVDDDADGVVIMPNNIVLTPSDYITPISVYVVTSGKVVEGTEINVFFRSSSNDEAVDGIEDMWMFKTGDQPPTSSPTTSSPTLSPSPTRTPTASPTDSPTTSPTKLPTASPTKSPTASPTTSPTASPLPTCNDHHNWKYTENKKKFNCGAVYKDNDLCEKKGKIGKKKQKVKGKFACRIACGNGKKCAIPTCVGDSEWIPKKVKEGVFENCASIDAMNTNKKKKRACASIGSDKKTFAYEACKQCQACADT